MKKKAVSLMRDFGPIVLYLDDLHSIAEMIESENGTVTVTLKDKNHEYEFKGKEGVAEISSLPAPCFHNIGINSHGDIYVSFTFNEISARAYVSEDTVKGRGIIEKAKAIFRPRNRLLSSILTNLALPTLAVMYGFISLKSLGHWFSLALFGSSAMWLVAAYMISFRQFSTLHTKARSEMPPFLVRKKDELILVLISVALGALLGALATLAISR